MKNIRTFLWVQSLMVIWLAGTLAHGQIPGVAFTTLAQFDSTNSGASPYAPPVLGSDGYLYGSLPLGGTNNAGTIFKISTNAAQNVSHKAFYTFSTLDGKDPYGSLVFGNNGNLYGVAYFGGTNNQGTLFELTTNGVFTLLYSFGMVTNALGYALDGANPIGGMVQGRDGNFYGTTFSGGTNNVGTVFRLSTNGALTTLYSFTGSGTNDDGAMPYEAPLVEGATGVFYGTTIAGGTNNDGTVFQITSDGTVTTLFEFNITNGQSPWAGLSFGTDGNLYGTTSRGGTNGYGTAFQITTNGVLTTLYHFGGPEKLYYVYGGVVPGNNNNLFGTAYYFGAYNHGPPSGAVFQLTTNGLLTPLCSFTNGMHGASPVAGVIRDASGDLYGTTSAGGTNGGNGTVYRLKFSTLLSVISPATNELWSNSVFTATGTASDNAPGGAITNVLYSMNGAPWTNAITENGWINWTAGGVLMPGSNTIAAYAMDSSGNASMTNTVRFLYVAALTVSTNGVASLRTNYNGALLTVGNHYSITATAGSGFAFVNWTGGTNLPLGVLTNNPTVQFVMEPNLMLQANLRDTTPPTLSITNLAAGQRVSNAVFTVRGKAGDNWQVTNVFYSLNGGVWSNAMTTNSWTNWFATVTLAPGTNAIAAYAVDPGGNVSLTNSVRFQYVVTNQLEIRAMGKGTISPNYSNAWLEIGRNYSITATAGSGFAFVNWTGGTNLPLGVLTNNSTVQFVMEPNLMLQANLRDTTPPTLSITNLAAGQRVSNAVFTVRGKAGDNWQVTNVFYSLNGGVWSNAMTTNSWTNWFATVTLAPGTNAIAAYAVDPGGNVSLTNSVRFQYVVTNQLEIRAMGKGTISPNYSNAWLEIGRNYSITATPATGFILTNWVVSTNFLGGSITNNATVQFMMASNLTLQVNFVETSKPSLTITAPTANQRMTNALANVVGTTTDNWGVAGVWYQLNSNAWRLASTTNSYTNWTQTVTLLAGTNSIRAFAQNLGGNLSTTSSVSVFSTNTFLLELALSNSPVTSNGLAIHLEISPGMNGHVQYSSNLVNWSILTNFIGTNSSLTILDPDITNLNSKFYRAVVP